MADIGGGGMLDIGCYPITVSRFIFDAEPKRVIAVYRPRSQIQDRPHWRAALPISARAASFTFMVSTQLAPFQRVQIGGTKGRIEVEIPFNAPPDVPNRYFLQGMEMNEGTGSRCPSPTSISSKAEAFGRVIRKKRGSIGASKMPSRT